MGVPTKYNYILKGNRKTKIMKNANKHSNFFFSKIQKKNFKKKMQKKIQKKIQKKNTKKKKTSKKKSK